ncbi:MULTISPECIES: hypothetical protein [unclassified Neorhizobium]|uniref:hypothetical protein n=1 Tax=unclassified Neorhizobium TaxID=2629175 RepID=UPI001FF12BA8|nr:MULTISPECIES: hypothetical protein [unclassified Neorhizobium]MCJ9674845.1 hypothetical protein [Neorhizobium sp. SHOUNA12B]MCJ9749067.1 hypothetical protein [Neorhizobium sp. SHOUNA12A]
MSQKTVSFADPATDAIATGMSPGGHRYVFRISDCSMTDNFFSEQAKGAPPGYTGPPFGIWTAKESRVESLATFRGPGVRAESGSPAPEVRTTGGADHGVSPNFKAPPGPTVQDDDDDDVSSVGSDDMSVLGDAITLYESMKFIVSYVEKRGRNSGNADVAPFVNLAEELALRGALDHLKTAKSSISRVEALAGCLAASSISNPPAPPPISNSPRPLTTIRISLPETSHTCVGNMFKQCKFNGSVSIVMGGATNHIMNEEEEGERSSPKRFTGDDPEIPDWLLA